MTRPLRPIGRAVLAIASLVLTSCADGPKLHPVRGTVLFLDQPPEGATVVFQPLNAEPGRLMPSGVIGADGQFRLRTQQKEGAPAGEYVVLVTWYPADAREQDSPKNRLPDRYGDPAKSPLRATVKDGPNELEPFRLTN